MGKIAFVFSGQGAQHAGMGREFFDCCPAVRPLFAEAEKIRPGTLAQCFEGSGDELRRTENTQPCLYLADLAAAVALKESGVAPDAVAGFSLGEIPSLAFAGAFSYGEGFRIACKRGELMAKAAEKADASMAAVLKLTNRQVEDACRRYGHIYPVNYNGPEQLVVSGLRGELEPFKEDIKAMGGRFVPLAVGGGFHSPFMNGAAEEFGRYLATENVQMPKLTAYSNYTAAPYGDDPRTLMQKQINHPVKWATLISDMESEGFDTFLEVGVGSVLQKLIMKIVKRGRAFSVENREGLAAVLKERESRA